MVVWAKRHTYTHRFSGSQQLSSLHLQHSGFTSPVLATNDTNVPTHLWHTVCLTPNMAFYFTEINWEEYLHVLFTFFRCRCQMLWRHSCISFLKFHQSYERWKRSNFGESSFLWTAVFCWNIQHQPQLGDILRSKFELARQNLKPSLRKLVSQRWFINFLC